MSSKAGEAIQRAGVLCELHDLIRECGVDPVPVFAGSGVKPATLRADTFLRFDTALQLLQRASEATALPHLGLLLGLRFKLAHHGILGRLMASAPTLRQALNDFVCWQPGYSSGAVVYVIRLDGAFALGYGIHDLFACGGRQVYDIGLGVGMRMVDELTGGAVKARELQASYKEPANAVLYRTMLKAPVVFDRDKTGLILDAAAMNTHLPNADQAERNKIVADIRSMMVQPLTQTSLRLRQVLRTMLHMGLPSMDDMASELGMHKRTLRRRLASEGVTFEEVRASVRFAIARELLEMTDLPMSQLSSAVAFASPGVFADAFRKWSGTSPTQWRASRRVAGHE